MCRANLSLFAESYSNKPDINIVLPLIPKIIGDLLLSFFFICSDNIKSLFLNDYDSMIVFIYSDTNILSRLLCMAQEFHTTRMLQRQTNHSYSFVWHFRAN